MPQGAISACHPAHAEMQTRALAHVSGHPVSLEGLEVFWVDGPDHEVGEHGVRDIPIVVDDLVLDVDFVVVRDRTHEPLRGSEAAATSLQGARRACYVHCAAPETAQVRSDRKARGPPQAPASLTCCGPCCHRTCTRAPIALAPISATSAE